MTSTGANKAPHVPVLVSEVMLQQTTVATVRPRRTPAADR